MVNANEIKETKVEIKNGIKYTTYYVDRSIRQGDPFGGSIGTKNVDGVDKVIEMINYIYK